MNIYNTDTLVKVEVVGLKHYIYLEWQKGKKHWLFNSWDTIDGFYDVLGHKTYSKEEIEKGKFCDIKLIVESNLVFYKPYVVLYFGNEKQIVKFDSVEEAYTYGSKIADEYMINKLIF